LRAARLKNRQKPRPKKRRPVKWVVGTIMDDFKRAEKPTWAWDQIRSQDGKDEVEVYVTIL
jgi:hypothetical protein